MKKKIDFMVTAFRDGFQSYFGSRVKGADILPAFEAACEAGFRHFEVGGGAQFQSLIFYCNENPFEIMDKYREIAGPDVNLQTLSRGINVIGLESQSSDVIDLHAKLFKKHGITTIRNFDALNDVNNLIYSGKCISGAGLNHEVTITMMDIPDPVKGLHDKEFYTEILKSILKEDIPFTSICFKDAAGTSTPKTVHETIKEARKLVGDDKKIIYHSHSSAGTCLSAYMAAVEAGADQVDLSIAPVSGGTAQPDVLSMAHILKGTDYYLDIDLAKVRKAESALKKALSDYVFPVEARKTDPDIISSAMPGGALTANTNMMRDMGIEEERYTKVMDRMNEVIACGGGGTSVTPVSQFYFQQAFNNEFFGPWTRIADGYGKMILGYFGKTPVSPDPEIIGIAKEKLNLEEFTGSVLEFNDKDKNKGISSAMEMLRSENLEETDENLFIAAVCGEKGVNFLNGKGEEKVFKVVGIPAAGSAAEEVQPEDKGSNEYVVNVNGTEYRIKMDGQKAIVNDELIDVDIKAIKKAEKQERKDQKKKAKEEKKAEKSSSSSDDFDGVLRSPLPGSVFNMKVKEGDEVSEGDVVMILDSMKMEVEVKTYHSGEVININVRTGDQVKTGDPLMVIEA